MDTLQDIKIVDLTRILAGPFATMILGDMGADVLKIEHPRRGDDTRRWGPPFVDDAETTATYYAAVNRNKRSIALDLKRRRGRDLLLRLLEDADVLTSNFSAGVMDRLDLAEATLAARFPRLIQCTISGHPPGDERTARPSFDLVIQAETGLMDLTGEPQGPPTKAGISIADELAGMYLVQGILGALLHRERTQQVRPVQVSLNEAMLSAFTYQTQNYLSAGVVPRRMGNEHPSLAPYRAYEVADGDIVVGVASEPQWESFCKAIGRPELAADARFCSNAERVRNRDALEPLLEATLAAQTSEAWITRLRAAGVPCGPVCSLGEALETEREQNSGLIVEAPDGLPMVGSPLVLGGRRARVRHSPPTLGEHTDAVLADLGLAAAEIAELRSAGIVA